MFIFFPPQKMVLFKVVYSLNVYYHTKFQGPTSTVTSYAGPHFDCYKLCRAPLRLVQVMQGPTSTGTSYISTAEV
jgi:hypothetical protein